jgi:hypothetical protein
MPEGKDRFEWLRIKRRHTLRNVRTLQPATCAA